VLDLDKPASFYVDPFLLRYNGTTLAQLWAPAGPANVSAVEAITIRQLLSMRAGLDDYNNSAMEVRSTEYDVRGCAGGGGVCVRPWNCLGVSARLKTCVFHCPPPPAGLFGQVDLCLHDDGPQVSPRRDSHPPHRRLTD
jgi:hypothetical protein